MAKKTNNIPFIPLLDPREIDQSIIRNWHKVQVASLSKTVHVIESDINSIQLYNPSMETTKKDWTPAMNKLVVSFLTKKSKVNKKERDQIKKQTEKLGLLIPVSDISEINPESFSHIMNILSQITADFNYIDLLDVLQEEINAETSHKTPLPFHGLKFSIERYINLFLFSESLIESVKYLEGWFSHISPINKQQLNTQQFFSWFYKVVDEVISNNSPVVLEDHDDFHVDVVTLIKKYKQKFIDELIEVKHSKSKYFFFNSFPEFEQDLELLLKEDYDLILFGNIVSRRNQLEIENIGIFNHLFEKALDEESFIDHLSKIFTRKNVVNKMKSMLTIKRSIQDFSLFGVDKNEFEDFVVQKSRLEENEIETFLKLAKNLLNTENVIFTNDINQSLTNYHLSICNSISAPFYNWEIISDKLIPKLNLAPLKETKNAIDYLKAKSAHEKAESLLLKKYIHTIATIQSRTALNNLINSVPSFFYLSNQKRWNIAIQQAEEAIRMRTAFRNQKMKELGIDLDEKFTEAQKNVFLTEMLLIEEEIQNYVPFVTAAFKTALPGKRTTEFDSFRHQSDGIEFDPETVFDSEKWIRGNVMKTLRTKIKKGEVTQVNCFCLDLSGSMDHNRMRNLYKIIYLLVTGLQSRKSFDAFHFFSNNFIPGVEFDYEYTRKNLLFKILTIISEVSGSQIAYAGLEGTNISDGIKGCEQRMHDFVQLLRNKKRDINLSCSMFVITDGEPSIGIRDLNILNKFIDDRRTETGFAIKGIYIKSKDDEKRLITKIFGEENSAETSSFEEGVQKLTNIMSKTYKEQRRNYKWKKKQLRGNVK
jgi:hypothetical protein